MSEQEDDAGPNDGIEAEWGADVSASAKVGLSTDAPSAWGSVYGAMNWDSDMAIFRGTTLGKRLKTKFTTNCSRRRALVAREAAEQARQQAREWRQEEEGLQRMLVKSAVEADQNVQDANSEEHQQKRIAGRLHKRNGPAGLQNRDSFFNNFGKRTELVPSGVAAETGAGGLSETAPENLPLKSGRKNARKPAVSDMLNKRKHRLQNIINARRTTYEAKPERERAALTDAFRSVCEEGKEDLSAGQLQVAFQRLGLAGVTHNEVKELSYICEEMALFRCDFLTYCIEAVPLARAKLRELRRVDLSHHFMFYDLDESNTLDRNECAMILDKMFSWNLDKSGQHEMQIAFYDEFERVKMPDVDEVEFEGFCTLIASCSESYCRITMDGYQNIIEEEELKKSDVVDYDVLVLHNYIFKRHAKLESGDLYSLGPTELIRALIELALYPYGEADRQTISDWMDPRRKEHPFSVHPPSEGFSPSDGLLFKGFLWVVEQLRAMSRRRERSGRKDLFDYCNTSHSGELNMTEVSGLLSVLGMVPRCREDQDMLRGLLEAVDKDGNGLFTFSEFENVMTGIEPRLTAAKRRDEWKAATAAGFDEDDALDLMEVFHMLCADSTCLLRIDSLRKILDRMRLKMPSDKLRELIKRFEGATPGAISFEQFFGFMRAVLADYAGTDAQGEEQQRNRGRSKRSFCNPSKRKTKFAVLPVF
jgi:Ca2+-binding EF-hand superfamily protein